MAVSRFTLPATQNTLSQYVSLPLEELTVAAGRKQLQADKNLGDIQGAQGILEKIPVNPWHQPAKDQFINQYRQEVSGLLDQGFDPSSPEFKKQSSNLINRYLSDPQLNTFARGFKTWENEEKTRASLAEEDKYQLYNDLNARIQQQALQTGTNPWVDPTTGKAVEYRQSPIRASSVHTKPVYELFDKMKPSGREAEGFQLDSQGNIIGVKSGYEGLAERFINNVADRNINTFLDTPEGQDFGRKVLASGEIKDLGQLRNAAKDYMRDIGTAYVFHKTEGGTSFKYGPQDVRAGLAQTQLDLNAPTTYNQATDNPYQGEKIIIDSKGNISGESNYFYKGQPVSKEEYNSLVRRTDKGGIMPEDLRVETKSQEQLNAENQKVNSLLDNYRTIYGKEKGYSEPDKKQIVELYNKAIDNSGKFIPRDINFSTKKSDMLTPQVLGGKNTIANLSNVPLQIVGNRGGKNITYEELNKELGLDKDNTIKSAKVMGRFANHPSIPGAYKVVVTTSDGTTKTLAVGTDESTEAFFKPFDRLFQSNLSGQDVNYKVGDVVYKTVNAPKKDGSGFNTRVIVSSPVGTEEMSLREFEDTVHKEYDKRFQSLYSAGYDTTTEEKQLATEEE